MSPIQAKAGMPDGAIERLYILPSDAYVNSTLFPGAGAAKPSAGSRRYTSPFMWVIFMPPVGDFGSISPG